MHSVLRYTRLFTDQHGMARFEEVEVALAPKNPAPDELSVSEPMRATAVVFGRVPARGSHPEQPERQRQLMVCLSGAGEITASGETRGFTAGDVLLVEDTTGFGHSSSTTEGFTVIVSSCSSQRTRHASDAYRQIGMG